LVINYLIWDHSLKIKKEFWMLLGLVAGPAIKLVTSL
jgi:hypothetical protein